METDNSREGVEETKQIISDLIIIGGKSVVETAFSVLLEIDKISETHHQELQKAREDWLREEIVKLEGMLEEIPREDDINLNTIVGKEKTLEIINVIKQTNKAIQTIIDRYQSNLDHPTISK